MRLFFIRSLMVGLLLFSASAASAVNLYTTNPDGNSFIVGDTFRVNLYVDAEGETGINLLYASVLNDNTFVASYVSGVSPPGIFPFATSFGSLTLPRNSQPVTDVPGDVPGRIRAASFGAPSPTGGTSNAQILAILTFSADHAGTTNINALVETMTAANNDRIDINGVNSTALVTTSDGPSITVVPEPGTALLMGLGLAGLGVAGRRKA